MQKGTAVILMLATFVGGYFLGSAVNKGGKPTGKTTTTETAKTADKGGDDVERFRVPLEGAAKGPATAKINIVAFSEFQCPFCSRALPAVEEVMKDYPGQVRMYFRHNPLPMHPDAPLASQAALAAGEQGKFWEMHDKLFANQQALKREDLEKYGQELGLDMEKFKGALDGGRFKSQVDQDMALGRQVGVQGTPTFFINGRPLRGAVPAAEFKKVIDDELIRVNRLLSEGTPIGQLYAKLMTSAKTQAEAPKPKGPGAGNEVYKVELGDAPSKGPKDAKVTVVIFSEFQCPFCKRVEPTLAELEKTYGNDVRFVFKHNPLSFHQYAMIASLAADAAGEQGKFWEMHDKLFANQQALTRPDLEKYAQELGLNMNKFKAALDKESGKARIQADMAQAEKLGARGTPQFFINGRNLRGAQPVEEFKKTIDEELKKADEKLRGGVKRENLYAEIIKNGLEKAAAPAQQQRPGAPDPNTVYKADLGAAPIKGGKDALVTIVQFSDFQCPFCSRVEPTMDKVLEEYKGNVRVAWKDNPLPFHNRAMPAALAARAAAAQGKFWEMHKKLFDNQKALEDADLEKYAQEVGLNMPKYKAFMADAKNQAAVKADQAEADKLGARGTPAFFINGKFLSGAQPFEAFKTKIDDELKTAQALAAKVGKGKVYDELMKTAKGEAPKAAPAAGGGEEQAPENDKAVYKVAAGDAPSKGAKGAPIEMVIFSDFQCPFCTRVNPTLDQIEKDYPGKVRTVWKNYPLPFHKDAGPAAEAALAAGAQGKFWEMHDKLFANQRALDRPSLEKYAEELKLDMAKFKADLDSGKWKSRIEAETKEGQAVGVSGTPAVFINGRRISGAYPIDTFKKVVDQELEKKGVKVAKK